MSLNQVIEVHEKTVSDNTLKRRVDHMLESERRLVQAHGESHPLIGVENAVISLDLSSSIVCLKLNKRSRDENT